MLLLLLQRSEPMAAGCAALLSLLIVPGPSPARWDHPGLRRGVALYCCRGVIGDVAACFRYGDSTGISKLVDPLATSTPGASMIHPMDRVIGQPPAGPAERKRQREAEIDRREESLDDALRGTFPASDPPALLTPHRRL